MEKRAGNLSSKALPRSGKRPLRWLKMGAAGLLIAITGLLIAGTTYQAVSTALDARRYPAPGPLVDVGGYRMHLYCTGEHREGVPTVILNASYPATVSSWVWIQPQVSTVTRVCAYDRAGAGWSDPSPAVPTMGQMAEELQILLDKSGETGPFVIVGHSWGAGVTRLFAAKYLDQVVGLVWIESTHPDGWARRELPESTLGGMPRNRRRGFPFWRVWDSSASFWGCAGAGYRSGSAEQWRGELTAYFNSTKWADHVLAVEKALPESLEQLRQVESLGEIPLAIVVGSASEEAMGIGPDLQRELSRLSPNNNMYWIEGADHSSLVHDPHYAQQTGARLQPVLAPLI